MNVINEVEVQFFAQKVIQMYSCISDEKVLNKNWNPFL